MIKVKEVLIECDKGAEIGNSIREATIIALQEKRNVALIFNDKRYEIIPFEIVDNILTKKTN